MGAALRQAAHGAGAQRTFRFRHTGNLQTKFAEARKVLGMTIAYEKQFKVVADSLALEPISEPALERRVLRHLWVVEEDIGLRARANRERAIEQVLAILRGRGTAGDTTGNSPGEQMVGVQRDRRAPRLRPAVHVADQSGAALVRGHRAQAASARAGVGGLTSEASSTATVTLGIRAALGCPAPHASVIAGCRAEAPGA